MNIETKIKELDIKITETQAIEREYWRVYDQKEKEVTLARNDWIKLTTKLRQLEIQKEALNQLVKDCERVISRGVPVPDCDISKTVLFRQADGTMTDRIPVLNNGQEKEHL